MSVGIRAIAEDEARRLAPTLVALAVRSKASWGYDRAFMAAFERSMQGMALDRPAGQTASILFVAEDAGAVVGFAAVEDEGERAWLEDLWVEPDRFGQGVGRALWLAAVEATRAMGRPTLELEADPNAVGFYERLGARVVGQRPSTLVEGRMLPLMRLEIGPAHLADERS